MEFPPILVINLDSRTDKWEQIQKDFQDWSVKLERISAIKHTIGWKGCYLSHLKCVKIAKERKYPWVLYLEDDCMLTPEAKQRFAKLLPFLWGTRKHWDFFMGGLTGVTGCALINQEQNLYIARGFGAHFCLIHNNTYDRILDIMEPDEPDEPDEPCDSLYRKAMRLWITVPFIAKQYAGHSDISDTHKDSYSEYDEAEQMLKLVL
jgi:hypothetical protein